MLIILHQRQDFLQLLMDARAPDDENEADNTSAYKKSVLTNKQIAGLYLDFMAADYESTSIALACASYLLSLNTKEQEHLCQATEDYYQENQVRSS